MKKTYFIKTFNLNLTLTLFSILSLLISLLFKLLIPWLEKENLAVPSILSFSEKLQNFTGFAMGLLFLCLIMSVTIEIISRILNDSLKNYIKSIVATFRFRRFARQSERIEKTTPDSQIKATINPIFQDFNQAIGKSVIDISEQKILVFINLPHSQQAQKILRDMEAMIKEEISGRNPNFYFSSPERFKNRLCFIGTKR